MITGDFIGLHITFRCSIVWKGKRRKDGGDDRDDVPEDKEVSTKTHNLNMKDHTK